MTGTAEIKMPYRFLGDTGLLVSVFSLGSWVTFDTQTDFKASYDLMVEAYKAGVNFFDNAEFYALGKSEEIMGQSIELGIKNGVWKREDLVVSTKMFFGDGSEGPNRKGLSRKHLIEGTKNSLKRMKLEYVDLLLCHRPDKETPIEETVRAMNYLINQGYAFYWGTSEWASDEIIQAHEIAEKLNLIPPYFEQPQYNIFERSKVDYHFQKLYKRYKYGLTVWSPLASGVLTGKYSGGKVPEGSRLSLSDYSWLQNYVLANAGKADQLIPIAKEIGCSLTQLSLAWCAANKNVSTVILGAKNATQLKENLSSLKFIKNITPEIRKRIDDIVQYQLQDEVDPFPELIQVRKQYLETDEVHSSVVKSPTGLKAEEGVVHKKASIAKP